MDLLKSIMGIGNNIGEFFSKKKKDLLDIFTPQIHSPIPTPKLSTYTPTPAPKISTQVVTPPKLSYNQPKQNTFLTDFFKNVSNNVISTSNPNSLNSKMGNFLTPLAQAPVKTITNNLPSYQRVGLDISGASKVIKQARDIATEMQKKGIKLPPYLVNIIEKYPKDSSPQDYLNTLSLIGSFNVPENIAGGGINVLLHGATENLPKKKPFFADSGKAYEQGYEFSSKLGPLNKIVGVTAGTLIKPLANKFPAVQKFLSYINPKEVENASTWLRKTLFETNKGGAEMGVFGYLQDAKNGAERLKNAWEQYKMGAIFSGTTSGVTNLLPATAGEITNFNKAHKENISKTFPNDVKYGIPNVVNHPEVNKFINAFNISPEDEAILTNAIQGKSNNFTSILATMKNKYLPNLPGSLTADDMAPVWEYIIQRKNGITPLDVPDILKPLDKAVYDTTGKNLRQSGFLKVGKDKGNETSMKVPEQPTTPTNRVSTKLTSNGQDGIVPEWGTQNQYYLNNPYKSQLDKMAKTKNFDIKIIEKSSKWEMEQVLKDKPAYLSSGTLPVSKIWNFAKKHDLAFGQTADHKPVIAKNKIILQKVIDSVNSKNQREIGLSLGYKDLSQPNNFISKSILPTTPTTPPLSPAENLAGGGVQPQGTTKPQTGARPAEQILKEIEAGTYQPRTRSTKLTKTTGNAVPAEIKTPIEALPPLKTPVSGTAKIGELPEKLPSSTGEKIDNLKTKFNELYTQALDRFNPLSKIAKQGGKEEAMQNALAQNYGAGSTANYHIDFELKPILKDIDANDLREFIIAQRDIELSGRNIKGSDKIAAESVITNLKQKYGGDISVLESSANKLYDYQKNLIKEYLVDTGVMSKKQYEGMVSKNQKYVPFQRVMDTVEESITGVPPRKGVGSVGSQNIIKTIKGSERQIYDPLESIVANTYKIVSLGRRNKVAQTLTNLIDKFPEIISLADKSTPANETVSVFRDGKTIKYQVPKDVAEAAKGLQEESLNTLIKILSIPTKVLRATATAYNPEFMAPNVVRDLQTAFVNTGLNPFKFAEGMYHLVKQDNVYQEFLRAGGRTSRVSIDRPYLEQTVGDIIGSGKGWIPKKPSDILNIIQTMGDYSEQPTRIAMFQKTYNQALKDGLSIEEARAKGAYSSQEGTVNFARRGSKTQAANALVAFFNARLQGVDRLFRTIKKDPVGGLLRMGMITQIPAVLGYLWNRNFQSFNNPAIISPYDKENNYIIMLSDQPISLLNGAQYIKIPKGDIGKFANPTEAALSYLDGKGDSNVIDQITKAFVSLAPINNLGDIIPQAIKPIAENTANYSFFRQRSIVPEYKKSLPAGYQSTAATMPIYKLIGQKINISPAQLESTAAGYFSGWEKLLSPILNKAATIISPSTATEKLTKGQNINRTPILRRFFGGAKMTEEEAMLSNQKRANSINFQINDIKSAIKRGDVPLEEGQNQILKLRQDQLKLKQMNTQTKRGGVVDADVQRYSTIYELDKYIQTNQETGIKKYKFESDKIDVARKLYGGDGPYADIPEDVRGKMIESMGFNAEAVQYDYMASQEDSIKSQYITDQLNQASLDHGTLINTLISGRVESLSGKMVASNGVIDDLYDAGIISKSEQIQLKKIKLGKNGLPTRSAISRSTTKAKKFSMVKPPDITEFVANSKPQTPMKLKPLSTEFFTGQVPGGTNIKIPSATPAIKIEDLIKNIKTQSTNLTKAKTLIQKLKGGKPNTTGPKLSKSFFSGNRSRS